MKKKISIIIPFYNEKENIVNIFKEIEELITKENKYLFEIIFMDNNSNDGYHNKFAMKYGLKKAFWFIILIKTYPVKIEIK